eukprot:TRINITY_DN943_c0_g1_i1.p1 TRINITY_DN943_c0_g1~~TRINITY_DN943_c0_g1_i1.p1  ORF type:complete len:570 (+),score=162.44 TRINITY_DN943_c0_g1_i1:48-1757(+)
MAGLGGSVLGRAGAKEYLERTNLGLVIESLLGHLLDKKPADPLLAISDWAAREQDNRRLEVAARRGTQLDHNIALDVDAKANATSAIGIIATIGPVSQPVDAMKTLMEAGVNIVRLNASHGDHTFHGKTIENARAAAKELGRTIAIALDTKGPEIRTGDVKGGGELQFKTGDKLKLTTDEAFRTEGTKDCIFVDYKNITQVMNVGQQVFVDDGVLSLVVTEKGDNYLQTEVVNGHTVSSRRGINLPHTHVDLPAVSEKDESDLKFAAQLGLDMVFASFIREGSQVREVRAKLAEGGNPNVKVISKIENHQGIENFDDILAESDGIMVARGDLGTEIPLEKVFLAQKMMIGKCNASGKPCIVATQMLESMIQNPRPTRAEASDVANAVLDGADIVMLSGETAKGPFGKECVATMRRVTLEAQVANREQNLFESVRALRQFPISMQESIVSSAVNSAYELQAVAIIALTNTGTTARLVAKYRPPCPIVAVTYNEATARQILLHRFVKPMLVSERDRERRLKLAMKHVLDIGLGKEGDKVILVHAGPMDKGEHGANLTRVVVLKDASAYELK